MTNTSNVNTLIKSGAELTPTIICVAESTHYLIGAVDPLNNLISLDKSNKIGITSSLTEAKNYLRNHNIFNATVEYQSAYDEMCGLSPSEACRQNITF